MARPRKRPTRNVKMRRQAYELLKEASEITGDTLVDLASVMILERAEREIVEGYARFKAKHGF